jgi:DNA-binding Xre family transcriptional regulator
MDNMIKCKLEDVARLRGYRNARQLADAINKHYPEGETVSYQTIYAWWNNTVKNYAQSTLNKLCAFLNTSPGMLLEYTPDSIASESERSQPAKVEQEKQRGSKRPTRAQSGVSALVVHA